MPKPVPVCLIIPPSPFLLDEKVFPSLGVLKVAAALRAAGHETHVLDLSGVTDYEDATSRFVYAHPAIRHYGITATTPQYPAAVKIAECIPRWTILGGPHATLVHAAYKRELNRAQTGGRALTAMMDMVRRFEVVIAGDGEKAIFEALDHGCQPIIDADDPKGNLFLNPSEISLDPARHMIDLDSYHYEIDGHRATSLIAQLGCPFGCNFCGGRYSPMLRRARIRTTESVIGELGRIFVDYGYTGYMFYDDELNVNKQLIPLLHSLIEFQRSVGCEFRFRGFVKAELFTAEQAELMYRAGFRWLLCGFESGSPRILTNINKRATREDNTRMLRTAHAHGLKVKALMSLGHPGEDRNTIWETKQWLMDERPDDFDATIITVYPGTPYYDDARHESGSTYYFECPNGDRLYHQDIDFSKQQAYYKGIPGEYKSYVWTDYLNPEQLVQERDALERDVRHALGLDYPTGPSKSFDRSMGQ